VGVLLLAFVFLAVRAADEDRWSLWAFGDATTLMTVRQWMQDGIFHHYGLELNKGYSAFTQDFDRPELKQHAHGNCATDVPGVGPDVYYTHYPSGYLYPFYFLARLGAGSLFAARLLAIVCSLLGTALLYRLFTRFARPSIAFFAVLFYLCSRMFLGYADSLVEHSFDDCLKFFFMLMSLKTFEPSQARARRINTALLWVTALLLYLQSWDSVLYVMVWMAGMDLLRTRRLRILRYATVFSAFGVGLGIQFAQNAWYLGPGKAVRDLVVRYNQIGAVHDRTIGTTLGEMGTATWSLLMKMTGIEFLPDGLVTGVLIATAIALAGFTANRLQTRQQDVDQGYPSIGFLLLLLACGSAFPVLLRRAAQMTYEGRQMAPFVGLLAASALVAGAEVLFAPTAASGKRAARVLYVIPALALAALLWGANLVGGATALNVAVPKTERALYLGDGYEELFLYDRSELAVVRHIGLRFAGRDDVVVFALNCVPYNSCDDLGLYAEVEPVFEYYAWAPVLSFGFAEQLVEDLQALKSVPGKTMTPFVITRTKQEKERVLALLGDTPAEVHTAAELLRAIGWPEDAIGALRERMDTHTKYDVAHEHLDSATEHSEFGDTLYQHALYERAERHYRRAIEIDPAAAPGHVGLGKTLQEFGREQDAEASFRAALAIDPDTFDAHSHLGCILADREANEEALLHFAEAVRLRQDDPETWCDHGNALVRTGNFEAALASFEKAIALAPGQYGAHLDMGRALAELERFDEAIEHYRRELAASPGDAEIYCDWGNALHAQEHYEDAIEQYRAAIAVAPDFFEAHLEMGSALAALDRKQEAIAALDRANALAEDDEDRETAEEMKRDLLENDEP